LAIITGDRLVRLRTSTVAASAHLAAVGLAVLPILAFAEPGSPFRYDDDVSGYARAAPPQDTYSAFKYHPLDLSGERYVSFGGDIRERFESYDVADLGFRSKESDQYLLHRALLYAHLHFDSARLFVQLGNHTETGREPHAAPTDVDRGDVQQAFADYRVRIGRDQLTLRAGRAEMSFDEGALIGLRDGPNVRQVWDGVRLIYRSAGWQADAFGVRPVNVSPAYFDDHSVGAQSLWGVHLTMSAKPGRRWSADTFYYGHRSDSVALFPKPGPERTHTVGARVRIGHGAVDGSVGAIGQVGHFGDRNVRAYALHLDAGVTLATQAASPRFGWRADLLSGSRDPAHGAVGTFNALYPNVSYSTEATIEAPANLMQTGVTARVQPMPGLSVTVLFEGLWRASVEDAFYAAPLFPLVPANGSRQRFIGTEGQASLDWTVTRAFRIQAAYVHFDPGAFVSHAGGRGENFGMFETSFRF
jgi:hypothetical protein